MLVAEDPDGFGALLDPPAQRVLGLEADEEHQVAVVADAVRQVVEDAPGLRPCPRPRR